jgi:hypothetical protein
MIMSSDLLELIGLVLLIELMNLSWCEENELSLRNNIIFLFLFLYFLFPEIKIFNTNTTMIVLKIKYK